MDVASQGDGETSYRLRGAGGVPDGGLVDGRARAAAESAADREVVSDRIAAGGETISSGGSIEGQKS